MIRNYRIPNGADDPQKVEDIKDMLKGCGGEVQNVLYSPPDCIIRVSFRKQSDMTEGDMVIVMTC